MAVSGWFSSCATDEAISPIVTRRLVTWAFSAWLAASASALRRAVMSVAISICASRPSVHCR